MKRIWNSFKIAFAMFSKIPMPQAEWTEENMKYMLCFFPFVGTVIGALTMLFVWVNHFASFQGSFAAALFALIPVLVTGGIHVDGLLDTADALSSWQERERRLEILKDSHAGAFAVITACAYFLAWFGAYCQIGLNETLLGEMAMGFMVSRSLSGIGVVSFKKAKAEGTVAKFSRDSTEWTVRVVLIGYLVLLFAGMVLLSPLAGAAAFAAAVLVFIYYHHMAMKYFGGTTGDLSGWFLCVCELGMALVLAFVSAFSGV
jgi:adenosylcobinamide-GDP ribazoletransferase